jgi:hypothetical protein
MGTAGRIIAVLFCVLVFIVCASFGSTAHEDEMRRARLEKSLARVQLDKVNSPRVREFILTQVQKLRIMKTHLYVLF